MNDIKCPCGLRDHMKKKIAAKQIVTIVARF